MTGTDGKKNRIARSDRLVYTLIFSVFRVLGVLPRKWGVYAGHFIGRIWIAVDGRHRGIALQNLKTAFSKEKSPQEIRLLAGAVFQNLAQIIFEIGWALKLDKSDFSRFFSFRGFDRLSNAYKRKKGVILLTGHLGNWELLAVVGAMAGYPINVLYRPLDIGGLDLFFYRYRTRFGARMISHARSMRRILRILKQGECLAILMDQNVDWYEGAFVEFFGKRACTNLGPALIASATEAAVLPVFLLRDGSAFVAEVGEEIPLIRTGDRRKDLEENTQRYNQILEAYIRRYPEQWFWVHQRWKTRPYHPWPSENSTLGKADAA
ncbi:MAG: hypothetical protein A2V65_04030 [Deltaproteobacteria bacterium RBG_13_49_15]|nr:MAG: hypothetical protein A2V65_04030 [Deltaproteobacteria bacterium RBG_13_49_15]